MRTTPWKHGFTWPTPDRPPRSYACRQFAHVGCTGYVEPYDTYMCGCTCHDPDDPPATEANRGPT